jgi:hypothetical protein
MQQTGVHAYDDESGKHIQIFVCPPSPDVRGYLNNTLGH